MFIDTMEFNTQFSPMGIQNFYKGTVIDNADPKKLGRVKVSIIEIFGSNDKTVLPWVTPFISSPHEFNCPEIGDEIVVFFPYGVVYFPCYIGHWHLTTNHDTAFDADYPDTIGFNRQGFSFLYNKKAKTLSIAHPTGSTISISAAGGITFNSVEKFTVTVTGDITFSTDAKANISGKGGTNVTSDGKVVVSGKGGATVSSDAEATFSGKSKTTVGDASSQTFVNGQMVLLAGGGVGVAVMGGTCMGIGNLGAPVISTIMVGSSKVMAPM